MTRELVVASYNLLAPLYVRPIDLRSGSIQGFAAFEWCKDSDLEWTGRRERLCARISKLASKADVIAFQEVEFEAGKPPAWLLECVEAHGLEVAGTPTASDLDRIAERNARVVGRRTAVGCLTVARSRAYARALSSTSLVTGHGDGWVVANVHLDATSEMRRLETVERAIEASRWEEGPDLRLVIAGDWNAELLPGSPLGALVMVSDATEAEVRREMASARWTDSVEAWDASRARARAARDRLRVALARVETGPTRVGLEEGVMRARSLDHLVYSARTCEPSSRAARSLDSESLAIGLPNAREPSDHAPVAATFRALTGGPPFPGLDDELAALLDAEAADRAATNALLPRADGDHHHDKGKKKKKKKKKEEEITTQSPVAEQIREARRLRALCKERAASRRRDFVERHGLDDGAGHRPARDWFERYLLAMRRTPTMSERGDAPPGGVSILVDAWVKHY